MATIKAIEDRTVHQIQSGQVIVDLCSVVKELVENSLDAGATSIEIRFKNQGLDLIEVQDNGSGITPENYATVALKHHTSKLTSYSDLTTLHTFGFRGEALSSLCALSKFTITTCMAADAPKGTKLDFEVSGRLKSTSLVAAQKGTTVAVENLFNNLPVRRRELERTIKREWNKVINVLGQYACIQKGVKVSVTQQTSAKGKKTTLFSTKGNASTRENIVNVFGAKTLTSLLTLDLKLELEATSAPSQRWSTQDDGGTKEIRISGHVSRPANGEGRQTPDKQMFFVNSRPCSLPQVAKAFNEVYKSYNSSQSPFIFANIEMDTHLYDVNVSPDKRTILLHDQTRMLEHLKTSLTTLFESQDYTVPISQLPAQKQPSYKQLTIPKHGPVVQTPKRASNAEITEDEAESAAGSRRASRDVDTDEDAPGKAYNPQFRRGAVSRESMSRSNEALNLIGKWAGRKADDRVDEDPAAEPKSAVAKPAGLSKEKLKLIEKLRQEAQLTEIAQSEASEDDVSSVGTPAPTYVPPRPVQDFNGRMQEASKKRTSPDDEAASSSETEEPIPAISPVKIPDPVALAPDATPRPLRTPAIMATITIGDKTVTSSLGTPCPKRARTQANPAHEVTASSLPSFGSKLSQRFAAPGTTQLTQVSDASTDIEEVDTSTPEGQAQAAASEESSAETGDGEATSPEDQIETPETADLDASALDSALLASIESEEADAVFVDEEEKKAQEDAKVQEMIQQAEAHAVLPSEDKVKRTAFLLKGSARSKNSTVHLVRDLHISISDVESQLRASSKMLNAHASSVVSEAVADESIDSADAEEKLSLTINKSDFAKMKIIGQFNLGFILASRTSATKSINESQNIGDDLFIIDQHASDEKYNFERLQSTTVVQSQRLVRPKVLDLTAVEEEIVMENLPTLETNGFVVSVDESGESPVGQRCSLVSLPLSRETTFSLTDLEELIALLSEHPGSSSGLGAGRVTRPSKVRKMFAMRACRSSIMIGKSLSAAQMGKVVKHMGEIDKPWNCPHGRPTMRHLCGLSAWDEVGWREGDWVTRGSDKEDYMDEADGELREANSAQRSIFAKDRGGTDWASYVRVRKEEMETD